MDEKDEIRSMVGDLLQYVDETMPEIKHRQRQKKRKTLWSLRSFGR